MEELVQKFPTQIEDALTLGKSFQFKDNIFPINNVVISGLGGSGIAASIVDNYVKDQINIPLIVNKTYFLPKFVNKNTLVIISSYSGNTEEALECLKQAIEKHATIICITSGGAILELAKNNNIDCIQVPCGFPPRACFGFTFVEVLFTLNHFELISNKFISELSISQQKLQDNQEVIKEIATNIATKIYNKIPVIYIESDYEGVAVRWRQQLNENSKMLAWHNAIPEMNHNELVGWTEYNDNLIVLFVRNESDYIRNKHRFEINKEVISRFTPHILDIYSEGDNFIERALYLIHLGDWISVFTGYKRNHDITEVNVIDYLKGQLAKA